MWSVLTTNNRNALITESNQTYKVDLLKMIRDQSSSFNFEPKWVWSMIEVESGWRSEATRFEATFCDRLRLKNPSMSEESLRKRSTSWGLGQILGQTALELGYPTTIDLSALANPTHGVHFALQYLHRKQLMYPDLDILAWIAAYNAGSVRLRAPGVYVNQYHVDKFKIALSYFDINPL